MSGLEPNVDQNWTKNLPKPPVPSLESTIEHYLAGLEAVIPTQQFEQTKQTAYNFVHDGEGHRLQTLLTEYAKQTDNWVTDFWLNDMYLCNPVPLVINSSPFFLLPKQVFKCVTDQINYAASLAFFAILFRDQINRQSLSQEQGKGQKKDQKLCMQTYHHFFGACRVPGHCKDKLVIHQQSNHFMVAAFNQFYAVHLGSNEIHDITDELAHCLHSIWTEAKANKRTSANVGILTTDNRRTWAETRTELLKDSTNEHNLALIEQSLFVLCLDDFVSPSVPTKSGYRNSIQIAKMDPSYLSSMLLHAGGSALHTSNRWFDKFLQIIVSMEGICGVVIEHSASEGITVLRFCEMFLDYYRKRESESNNATSMQSAPQFKRNITVQALHWNISPQVDLQIKQSEKQADKLIQDLDMYVLHFVEFGTTFIKQQQMSPDVFIQLALQLTYFKLHRRLVSTYESCSLRQFRGGRVDNIRAATKEALTWTRAMCGQTDLSNEDKLSHFQAAIAKQTQVLKYTSAGFGPDNHLLALRELSKVHQQRVPALFKEKSFKEFINFRLSTSQLFTPEDILIGYGAVVPDGYGCCYMPKADHIHFCISSFYSAAETSSDFFASSLESSLLQMRELCHQMATAKH